jgi:hypothetical protein
MNKRKWALIVWDQVNGRDIACMGRKKTGLSRFSSHCIDPGAGDYFVYGEKFISVNVSP